MPSRRLTSCPCEAILARTDGLDRVSHRDEWPSWLASMVTMNRNLGSLPMVGGNTAELIDSYEGSIKVMADAIDEAHHFVHVEFFILVQDEATAPVLIRSNALLGEGFGYACCPTTSLSSCIQIARERSAGLPQWERSIGRCCRCSRCASIGVVPTCVIIESCSL